jgi:hypothetical protein
MNNCSFGPWATAINSGSNPQLSRFWRRRLTRLPAVAQSTPAITRASMMTVLALGLAIGLMPTLYGSDPPAAAGKAGAATQPDGKQPGTTAAAADGIDLTFLPPKADSFFLARPAMIYEHLAGTPWGKQWDGTIEGLRMADFPQVLCAGATISGKNEAWCVGCRRLVGQSLRPLDAATMLAWGGRNLWPKGTSFAVRDCDGRKLYVPTKTKWKITVLSYDDRTMILDSPDELRACLGGKRGALPAYLPAKAWEEFRTDDAVLAMNQGVPPRILEVAKGHSPAEYAAFQRVGPLFRDAKFVLIGIQLNDPVRIHALAGAADGPSAEEIKNAAETARRMALEAIPGGRAVLANKKSQPVWEKPAFWEPLLAHMRFSREGTLVCMESLVPMATLQDSVVSLSAKDKAAPRPPSRNGDNPDTR